MVAAFTTAGLALGVSGDKKSTPPNTQESAKPKRVLPKLSVELDRLEARRKAIFSELKLNDAKAKQINDLFDQKRQDIVKLVREGQEQRRDNAERIEAVLARITETQKANDADGRREAIDELQRIDHGRSRIFKAMLGFDSRVTRALGEEYGTDYRNIMERLQKQWGMRRTPASFSIVTQLLDKVRPTKGQRAMVHEALKELSPALAESNKQYQARRKLLIEAQFRQRTLDVLTDAQHEQYLQLEEAYRKEWRIPDYPPVAGTKRRSPKN